MVKKRIIIKEVAEFSGVSITTISSILDGSTEKFGPRTVRRVLTTREELGYQPNYFARQMIAKETKTINALVPNITNPFFSTLMRGIEDILYNQNFVAILCNADSDHQKEIEYLAGPTRRDVDGFIIATSAVPTGAINEDLKKQGQPSIVLDQERSKGFSGTVRADDFRGGYLAGMHLSSLGHQTIALTYPESLPGDVRTRVDGFKSAFGVYQIPHNHLTLLPTQFLKQGGYQITAELLDSAIAGTSALNNKLAPGLYHGLEEAGKNIPEDYSIIGYNNVDMCKYIRPKLTTIA